MAGQQDGDGGSGLANQSAYPDQVGNGLHQGSLRDPLRSLVGVAFPIAALVLTGARPPRGVRLGGHGSSVRTGLRGLASEPPTVEPDPDNAGAGSQRRDPSPCEHGEDTYAGRPGDRWRGDRPRHRMALPATRPSGDGGRPGTRVGSLLRGGRHARHRQPNCTTASRPCSSSTWTQPAGIRSLPRNSRPPPDKTSVTAASGALVAAWDDADLASLRDLQSFGSSLGLATELLTSREIRRTGTGARVRRGGWLVRAGRSRGRQPAAPRRLIAGGAHIRRGASAASAWSPSRRRPRGSRASVLSRNTRSVPTPWCSPAGAWSAQLPDPGGLALPLSGR